MRTINKIFSKRPARKGDSLIHK
ncbi:hypothetical protein LCGC14_2602800, partial [marine sediment metagenome]